MVGRGMAGMFERIDRTGSIPAARCADSVSLCRRHWREAVDDGTAGQTGRSAQIFIFLKIGSGMWRMISMIQRQKNGV